MLDSAAFKKRNKRLGHEMLRKKAKRNRWIAIAGEKAREEMAIGMFLLTGKEVVTKMNERAGEQMNGGYHCRVLAT